MKKIIISLLITIIITGCSAKFSDTEYKTYHGKTETECREKIFTCSENQIKFFEGEENNACGCAEIEKKEYISEDPRECTLELLFLAKHTCPEGKIKFINENGCGCATEKK